jgi:hypothetical protein
MERVLRFDRGNPADVMPATARNRKLQGRSDVRRDSRDFEVRVRSPPLLSIDGIPIDRVMDSAPQQFGDKAPISELGAA